MGSLDGKVHWQEKAAKKRQECASKLPQGWKFSEQFMAGFQPPISKHKNDLFELKQFASQGF
jgi:hypothetical protein